MAVKKGVSYGPQEAPPLEENNICLDCSTLYKDSIYVKEFGLCKICLLKRLYSSGNPISSGVFKEFGRNKKSKPRYGSRCSICGFKLLLHYHHIIPVKSITSHVPPDIIKKYKRKRIVVCPNCHSLIHAGFLIIFGILLKKTGRRYKVTYHKYYKTWGKISLFNEFYSCRFYTMPQYPKTSIKKGNGVHYRVNK